MAASIVARIVEAMLITAELRKRAQVLVRIVEDKTSGIELRCEIDEGQIGRRSIECGFTFDRGERKPIDGEQTNDAP
jgi:hypothetical protein